MAARIMVKENGSIRVEGEFELVDATGKPFALAPGAGVSLCRCGNTKKSPFCDGSHKTCGFVSPSCADPAPVA